MTINGITDAELAEVLEIKAQHPNVLNFSPQQLQVQHQAGSGGSYYTNAVISGAGEGGMRVVQDVLSFLLKKDEPTKVQGQ